MIEDELLIAFADGECSDADRARVELALAEDPAMREKLEQHRRTVDDERPPRGEGAEPRDVVDLAQRRPARRVHQAPEERAQGPLEGRGELARSVGQATHPWFDDSRACVPTATGISALRLDTADVRRCAPDPRGRARREVSPSGSACCARSAR